MFLLRAGECFEKIFKTDRGERLVFQAIQRFDTSIFDYTKAIAQLESLINKRKYDEAITQIREIAIFFRKLETQLDIAPEFNRTFVNLKQNVRARLIHQISEFNFLKMICYHLLRDSDNVQLITE